MEVFWMMSTTCCDKQKTWYQMITSSVFESFESLNTYVEVLIEIGEQHGQTEFPFSTLVPEIAEPV